MVNRLNQIFKRVSDATAGVVWQLKNSTFKGFKFGTANLIYEDSSGNLNVLNPTTGKSVDINGNGSIKFYKDGNLRASVSDSGLNLPSGKYIRLYDSANTVFSSIVEDGDYLRFKDKSGNSTIMIADTFTRFQDGDVVIDDNVRPDVDDTGEVGESTLSWGKGWINEIYSKELIRLSNPSAGYIQHGYATEDLTFAIGEGTTPKQTSALIPSNAIIDAISTKVITAPGGGATTINAKVVGDGTNTLLDALAIATGEGNNISDGDGTRKNPWGNDTAVGISANTDADVTGSEMVVRFTVFYRLVSN